MSSGLFITLEGPDGAGKSTQVRRLAEALAGSDPLLVREPGGTALGESVRELLLHRHDLTIGPEAEMHLFMAARAELLEERIRPALAAGRIVIADRYHDATLVYQGAVGGILTTWPASFPRPDLTVLLMVPAEVGLARQADAGKTPDRMESRPLAFHQAVARGYLALAEAEPERFLLLDGTREPKALTGAIMDRVESLRGARR
ncbi:MAG TPA: dTMP kinase [Candidatus Dormibacteraeota bacterium]|jgi:dTMP kinase|nr:dTMP kinase [Candidatus Dormibacteraeota bacterium]